MRTGKGHAPVLDPVTTTAKGQAGGHRVTLRKYAIGITAAAAGPTHHEITVGIHTCRAAHLISRRRCGVHQRLAGLCSAIALELAGVYVPRPDRIAVLTIRRPHDDEIAIGIHRDGRLLLAVNRGFSDQEFGDGLCTVGVEAPGDNGWGGVRLVKAHPRDDEVSGSIHTNAGTELCTSRGRVHLELGDSLGAAGIEASCGDAVIVGGADAPPGDDKITGIIDRYRDMVLVLTGMAVDLELRTLCRTTAVEYARKHIMLVARGFLVGPGDHKTAVTCHRNGRFYLFLRRVVVDGDFATQWRSGGVEATRKDSLTVSIVALPGHHEVTTRRPYRSPAPTEHPSWHRY